MAIQSYFFNAIKDEQGYDRVYDSEDVTSYLDKIVGNGVFPNPSTNLQVQASSGMNVVVKAGQGWINGHKMISTTDLPLTIAAADVLLGRIDAVIFYFDMNTREMGITVKQGTKAANPVAPVMTRTTSRWEMCLAEITVAKQVTSITAANIKDTRGNSSVCGYVQGLIQQVDTTTLWTQFQTEYQQAIDADQADFDAWFDQVKDTLATATLLQKLEQVFTTTSPITSFDVTNYIPSYKFSIDILEVYIDGLRLDENEYTLSQSTVALATPITHAGTEVALVVYKSIDGSEAESIVTQVQEMQEVVDTLETGVYMATGENDNGKLSQIVQDFLTGGNDYRQLELDVYGDLACTSPSSTVGSIAYWFDFSATSSTRRVRLNFAHASRIIVDAANSSATTDVLFNANGAEIANLQAVLNNAATGQMIVGDCTVENSAFWLNGATGQTGKLVGAEQGIFENCRFSVTGASGLTYCISGNGNLLQLTNSEFIAYNASSASNESVAVQVQGNETENVLIMTNCSCPIKARNGYKQSNVVKVNSGFYCLTGNMLGKAAALYSTGDGKTETGTMIVSKSRMAQ